MKDDPSATPPDDDAGQAGQQISESRMRQALGIDARQGNDRQGNDRHGNDRHGNDRHGGERHAGGSGAPRRRFVADGDVPVVMIGRRRDGATGERTDQPAALAERLAAVEAALAAERDARARAEASLIEARHLIQQLQTQVAHADLARDEAVAHARRANAERGEAVRELQAAQRAQAAPAPSAAASPAPPAIELRMPIAAAGDRPARISRGALNGAGDVPAFTAQIVAAYLTRNQLSPAELPRLAESVVRALLTRP